jgi:hypothetical protein
MKIKEIPGKVWSFLWKDNSVWSWLADIVLVFIIIKFIFFPLMSLIFAAPLPFVIIESCSLEHFATDCGGVKNIQICGNQFPEQRFFEFDEYWALCGPWYENIDITKNEFEKMPFKDGLNKGDIIVVFGKTAEEYQVGDIIIFENACQSTPIIHRIVEIEERNDKLLFSTKGDNNPTQVPCLGLNIEKDIREEQILGKAVMRIPLIGWIKLAPIELFNLIF